MANLHKMHTFMIFTYIVHTQCANKNAVCRKMCLVNLCLNVFINAVCFVYNPERLVSYAIVDSVIVTPNFKYKTNLVIVYNIHNI